ncbi:MAG: non-canonical purine NTP pyrophosphatase [Candidatus Diapherotrites archaeon]|nr:non-canonical purine NTP pyrophosphatase [Candidatus Diapherotrites archaeon]
MAIVFVTNNDYKFREIQAILEPLGISIWQKKIDLYEPESGSIEEIAFEKAKQAYEKLKTPLIAEDTGLFFEAYNNFPGTKPKRIFEQFGYEGLFKKLKGKQRNAFFQTAICFMGYNNEFRIFEAKLHGKITGNVILPNADRMPYEKIFIPQGHNLALSQLSMNEKNEFSHRANAAKQLARYLVEKEMKERATQE